MIRAVIFDCFGVLTTDGWLAFKEKYLPVGSDSEAEAISLNKQADSGYISQSEFEQKISVLANVSIDETQKIVDQHVRNEALFEFIRDNLKANYKIGLLSNVTANFMDELFLPWQIELFDAMTFSFEVGTVKPDALMYETIATKLDCLSEECIFIDDREVFVEGARQAGMQGLHFTGTMQTVNDLSSVLTK